MGGKKKDKKKKGLGAEKTAAKMEKKITAKLKKELAIRGEDDVESMIAKFVEEDRKKNTRTVTEAPIDRPSKRSSFTLVAHPTKDLLLMFGGEWCSGKSTILYNDLFSYDIKKQKWAKLECPGGPPPRSSHQAACIAGDGGQMWVFGGEFASPSESQFYHYRDLWVFQLKDRRWEKIETKGGPSGRSGHRMVVLQTPNFPPRLAIFGGFHDSLRGDCRYYNDFHLFDLSERVWRKIEIAGQPPAPRSGHLMAALPDGRIFIHGGFSKVKVAGSKKKGGDDEVGMVHTDSFFLTPDKRDTTGTKFKWVQVKSSGQVPSKRCSSTLAAWTESGKSQAVVFGGVFDTEDEEDRLSDSDEETEDDSTGIFYDELYSVDLTKPSWKLVELTGPRVVEGGQKKRRRRKSKGEGDVEEDESDEEDDDEEEEEREEEAKMPEQEVKTVDDGVFTVTIGPSTTQTSKRTHDSRAEGATAAVPKTGPSPRMSSGMTIKNGVLYSFGGLVERSNGATVTYSDFYSLDLKKLDEWKCLLEPAEDEAMEVDESEEEDEDDEEEESDEDDDDDEEDCDDDEGEGGASAMQVG